MASENFSLKWNDFEKNISGGLRDIRSSGEFLDVTLVCEQEQVQAHKLVLSACSTFFRNIFTRNPSPNPLIYLRGVSYADMTAVLNFMYHGEVNVAQEDLNTFLAIAEDLKVKGLTQHDSAKEIREDKGADIAEKSERSTNSVESPGVERKRSIKRPTEAPLQKKTREAEGHENEVVHIKSEPTFSSVESPANAISIAEVNYGRETSGAMVKPAEGGFRDDGLDMEDGLDREDGLDSHLDYSYSDYHEVSYGEGSQMSSDGLSKGGAFMANEILPLDPLRRKRDAILEFIRINKAKLNNGYLCLICDKMVNDNSNMNKHLEFKHSEELKSYLNQLF